MKNILCSTGLLLLLATHAPGSGAGFGGKARVESDNFIVMAYDLEVARRVGQDVERRKGEISRALGLSQTGRWEPKCEIYICDNKTSYELESGAPAWSRGWSKLEVVKKTAAGSAPVYDVTRTVYTFELDSYQELVSVINHELAHVVFRDAVGPSAKIPRWLDEGVANFIQSDGLEDYRKLSKRQVKRGSSAPLSVLFSEEDYPEEKTPFYAESASVVDMMISTFGHVPFLTFARLVVKGVPTSRAINDAYSTFTGSVDDFEDQWKKYVLNSY